MLNDAELFELEILLIDKFDKFDFSNIVIDLENDKVSTDSKEVKELIQLCFDNRYQENGNDFIISLDVFKILQSRYFRNNKTIIIP
jgi:hypothetical protein